VACVATAHAAGRPCAPPAQTEAQTEALERTAVAKAASEPASPGAGWLRGRGFAFGVNQAASAALACAPPNLARAGLTRAVLAAERALGTDVEIAIVLTTHALSCGNIYYVPLANDVRGIGYRHVDPREVFDDTPDHRLEGIAVLNDWPYWQSRLDELESAFNHEVGHRWGARVHARIGGADSSALLGREQEHWSYFVDSGGSPLEGNAWHATAFGHASDTPEFPAQFSALDRYLMGVAAPAEVPPFELLVDPTPDANDCVGRGVGPASPPQTCGSLELQARAVSVSIEDVIDIEGPREPAADPTPRQVAALVLVLQSRAEIWRASDCESLARSVHDRIDAFERASAGRLRLVNALDVSSGAGSSHGSSDPTESGMACDELSRASSALLATPASPSAAPTSASSTESGAPPALVDRSSCASSPRPSVGASSVCVVAVTLIALGGRLLVRRARRSP